MSAKDNFDLESFGQKPTRHNKAQVGKRDKKGY
jgi:hypothetical protein